MTRPTGSSTKTPRAASAADTRARRAARGGRSRARQGSAAEQVRAGLRERFAESAALLGEAAAAPREVVHGFRKLMKRVRAIIRLLSDADGLECTFIEQTCRDVARRFSALRDLDVMLAALAARHDAPAYWPADLRQHLLAAREAELARGVLEQPALDEMTAQLGAADAAVAALALEHLSAGKLRRALERSHRKARRALHRCRSTLDDEHFHDLRKRCKRELYQRELLEAVMDLPHRHRTARLDAVCKSLGEQQDLAVLRRTIAAAGALTPELDERLSDRRDRVRRRAIRQATSLYG
jgi:CHAD domain-containing protein